MTTLSTRLGLKKHTTADQFHIADYAGNWQILDGSPGVFVCTSSTRPATWTSDHNGMLISETDTGLLWRWNGTAFVRFYGKGLLGEASRTTDASTSSTTEITILTAATTIPAGGRSVLVTVAGPGVYNTAGVTRMWLYRGATEIQSWLQRGYVGGTWDRQPEPASLVQPDTPPTAGALSYTLRFAAEPGFAGTSTLMASTNRPLTLRVVEV